MSYMDPMGMFVWFFSVPPPPKKKNEVAWCGETPSAENNGLIYNIPEMAGTTQWFPIS